MMETWNGMEGMEWMEWITEWNGMEEWTWMPAHQGRTELRRCRHDLRLAGIRNDNFVFDHKGQRFMLYNGNGYDLTWV